VSTAHATAPKKTRCPRTADKKGISASATSPPARNTALRIQTAPLNTSRTAMADEQTGRRASLPISQNAGSAKIRFIPVYKTAFTAPDALIGSDRTGSPRP